MALLARSQAVATGPRCAQSLPAVSRRGRVAARSAALNAAPTVVVQSVDENSKIVNLTGETYASYIAANELVLVDYYTDWCGPCKMIAPHLETMAVELPSIKFCKLNCTTEAAAKKIAMAQQVKALPTFHLFRGGERIGVFVGGKPQQLRKFVEEHLATN